MTSISKRHTNSILKEYDAAAEVIREFPELNQPIDEEESDRIRAKIDRRVIPLIMATYFVQYMDKSSLGHAMILGLPKDISLTDSQYNWLGTIFYVSYLLFEYPQNLGLQRFPVGKYLALNIFAWAVAIFAHLFCKNFLQLLVCRFILGACEGCSAAAFMIVISMFYQRNEQGLRVGFWFLMSGVSLIITSLLGYWISKSKADLIAPWKLFLLVTSLLTFLVSMAVFVLFPDSPASARFLTREERVKAVVRIKSNQTGIENKTFKKHQAMEALKDIKTWMWFFYCMMAAISNFTAQQSLIVKSMGFTEAETLLLTAASGLVITLSILLSVVLVRIFKDSRALVSVAMSLINLTGSILSLVLAWDHHVGLLIAIYLNYFSSCAYVIAIGWITATSAGHSKRITVQAMVLIGNCIGNIIAPQLWQTQFKPRNQVPWAIITASYVVSSCILLFMRFYLQRQNTLRDRQAAHQDFPRAQHQKATQTNTELDTESLDIDKEFMDLTDLENKDFRYVL
ncbi:hypothetical protein O181_054694 [Austropuccinia psidii MF-1]|uniref:Major facilitator superfamily (MFS) profile domain-containing protein n=1 Tax=Austropuccinia psidii MF-1 TaxID=1389203 RepID=A0A9Q3E520_9BASI|nr:hypothetical protein [Austropuccinia psidii MF-1]